MFVVFKDLADRIAREVYENWKVQDVCWGNEYTCQPFKGSSRVFKWNSLWGGEWEMLKHPVLYTKCLKCLRPATAQLFCTECLPYTPTDRIVGRAMNAAIQSETLVVLFGNNQ